MMWINPITRSSSAVFAILFTGSIALADEWWVGSDIESCRPAQMAMTEFTKGLDAEGTTFSFVPGTSKNDVYILSAPSKNMLGVWAKTLAKCEHGQDFARIHLAMGLALAKAKTGGLAVPKGKAKQTDLIRKLYNEHYGKNVSAQDFGNLIHRHDKLLK
jgi:hypothetical protein